MFCGLINIEYSNKVKHYNSRTQTQTIDVIDNKLQIYMKYIYKQEKPSNTVSPCK